MIRPTFAQSSLRDPGPTLLVPASIVRAPYVLAEDVHNPYTIFDSAATRVDGHGVAEPVVLCGVVGRQRGQLFAITRVPEDA